MSRKTAAPKTTPYEAKLKRVEAMAEAYAARLFASLALSVDELQNFLSELRIPPIVISPSTPS